MQWSKKPSHVTVPLNAHRRGEPVELIEQLQHSPLHLPVARLLAVKPLRPNRVQLIDKDNSRRLLLRQREGVPHQLRPVADEHLDELRAGQLEEAGLGLGRACAGHQRLASARRPVEQHPLFGPGLAIRIPPKKTHPKKPLKMFIFILFFYF
jgi:hypothetical protein